MIGKKLLKLAESNGIKGKAPQVSETSGRDRMQG